MTGGLLGADDLVVVSHMSPDTPGRDGKPVYLGRLLIEPRRHTPGLAELTDAEATAIGMWLTRGSRALRANGAEHVYSMVIGHAVDHLHVHLAPRYPGTPKEYWWNRLEEWPDAPMGGVDDVARVVRDLRAHLDDPAR